MSFFKNAAVFTSGVIVGAAGLTAFVGYRAFKMLKKNDVLYSAVEESVKAGVHTGGNELGHRLAKIATDWIFDKPKPASNNRIQYSKRDGYAPTYDVPIYTTSDDAEDALKTLKDVIKQYGFASIGDLYDASSLPNNDYRFNKYGWTNLDGAMVIHTTLGYTLVLPNVRHE